MLKKLLIIILIAAVIVGAFLVYLYFQNRQQPPLNTNQPVNTNQNLNTGQLPPVNTNVNQNINRPTPILDPETRTKNNLRAIVISFAERFGSYSNQSNFDNIRELKPFMTAKMARWADDYIKNLSAESGTPAIYHGFTTRVLKTEFLSFNMSAGTATLMLSTQREEQTGSRENSRTFYQEIKIEMLKQDEVWKVSAAYWQ